MPVLSFDRDDETGEIARPDSMLVGEIIASAERARFVPIEPHPSSHRLGSTPHSLADIAAIFGQWYLLPDALEAVRPIGESDDDAGELTY